VLERRARQPRVQPAPSDGRHVDSHSRHAPTDDGQLQYTLERNRRDLDRRADPRAITYKAARNNQPGLHDDEHQGCVSSRTSTARGRPQELVLNGSASARRCVTDRLALREARSTDAREVARERRRKPRGSIFSRWRARIRSRCLAVDFLRGAASRGGAGRGVSSPVTHGANYARRVC